MTRAFILSAATLATLAVTAAPAEAQRWNDRGWRTIAVKRVDGRDTDTIYLPGRTRQQAVRVCAMSAPFHLRDFQIRFENGGRQDVNTRAVIAPGTCTRAVDLRGNRRDIDRIRLRYEPILRIPLRPTLRVQVR
jgi:hypothetical protein